MMSYGRTGTAFCKPRSKHKKCNLPGSMHHSSVKTLAPLDDFLAISTAQRDEFRDIGHLLVRGLLKTSEIGAYRGQVIEAAKRQNREKRKAPERGIYGRSFGQLVNLWRADEGVRQLVLSKRLAKVAADLMGVSNVRIYHDH